MMVPPFKEIPPGPLSRESAAELMRGLELLRWLEGLSVAPPLQLQKQAAGDLLTATLPDPVRAVLRTDSEDDFRGRTDGAFQQAVTLLSERLVPAMRLLFLGDDTEEVGRRRRRAASIIVEKQQTCIDRRLRTKKLCFTVGDEFMCLGDQAELKGELSYAVNPNADSPYAPEEPGDGTTKYPSAGGWWTGDVKFDCADCKANSNTGPVPFTIDQPHCAGTVTVRMLDNCFGVFLMDATLDYTLTGFTFNPDTSEYDLPYSDHRIEKTCQANGDCDPPRSGAIIGWQHFPIDHLRALYIDVHVCETCIDLETVDRLYLTLDCPDCLCLHGRKFEMAFDELETHKWRLSTAVNCGDGIVVGVEATLTDQEAGCAAMRLTLTIGGGKVLDAAAPTGTCSCAPPFATYQGSFPGEAFAGCQGPISAALSG